MRIAIGQCSGGGKRCMHTDLWLCVMSLIGALAVQDIGHLQTNRVSGSARGSREGTTAAPSHTEHSTFGFEFANVPKCLSSITPAPRLAMSVGRTLDNCWEADSLFIGGGRPRASFAGHGMPVFVKSQHWRTALVITIVSGIHSEGPRNRNRLVLCKS
jgi:hypothetical protein